jgi:hypothetical protein
MASRYSKQLPNAQINLSQFLPNHKQASTTKGAYLNSSGSDNKMTTFQTSKMSNSKSQHLNVPSRFEAPRRSQQQMDSNIFKVSDVDQDDPTPEKALEEENEVRLSCSSFVFQKHDHKDRFSQQTEINR